MPDEAIDGEKRLDENCATEPTEAECIEQGVGSRTQSPPKDSETDRDCEETPAQNDLADRLQAAEREIKDLNSKYLRALADYDNAKKRARAEREGLRLTVICELVESLLPAIDNLDRAIESGECADASALVEGVKMVRSQIMNVFEAEGVRRIDAVGAQFDPNKHDAVMVAELSEHEDNTVVEEFQKGYEANGRVIRPSMVKVNKIPD